MQISEIIKDSFIYPFTDKRQFGIVTLIFLLLGVIMAGSFIALIYFTDLDFSGLGLLIFIVSLFVFLLVSIFLGGYQLDIVKIACEQDDEMPVFNPKENIKNGLKAILLYLIFYVIAGIVSTICTFLSVIFLSTGERFAIVLAIVLDVISIILSIFISWIFSMALCRLAYHDSLDEGLDLKQAYVDLRTIGLLNMLVYVIVMGIIFTVIITLLLVVVVSLIQTLNDAVFDFITVLILCAITSYLTVVSSRAMGLLYSNVVFGE